MAKSLYPVAFAAEFRGLEAPRSFTDRDTGEVVNLGAVLKLERDAGDGDVASVYVRLSDKVEHGFEPSALKRGELVQVSGEVVVYDNQPGYFRALRVERQAANGRQPAAA